MFSNFSRLFCTRLRSRRDVTYHLTVSWIYIFRWPCPWQVQHITRPWPWQVLQLQNKHTKMVKITYLSPHLTKSNKIEQRRSTRSCGALSLTWPASMQIYWNKRKSLHKKRVQLPQDWFGTPKWPPFHCFGTPIWPPWRHVKTLYRTFFPLFSHFILFLWFWTDNLESRIRETFAYGIQNPGLKNPELNSRNSESRKRLESRI